MISRPANLSFQNIRSSSIVRAAPRMRANRTSTPPSPCPQNELQKSRDRLFWNTGEFARANLDKEVVDGCLLADIVVSPMRGGECEETADVGALGKCWVVAVNESPVHQGVVHLVARAVCIAQPRRYRAFLMLTLTGIGDLFLLDSPTYVLRQIILCPRLWKYLLLRYLDCVTML